jgi:hypothetical protein
MLHKCHKVGFYAECRYAKCRCALYAPWHVSVWLVVHVNLLFPAERKDSGQGIHIEGEGSVRLASLF